MEQIISTLEQLISWGQTAVPIIAVVVIFISGGMFAWGEQSRQKAKNFFISGGAGVMLMLGATTIADEIISKINF